jgi:hypothetical protein
LRTYREKLASGEPIRATTRARLNADIAYLERFAGMGLDDLLSSLQSIDEITNADDFEAREWTDLDPEENPLLQRVSDVCDTVEERQAHLEDDDAMLDEYGEAMRPLDLGGPN